jgi:hypothetical protein
LFDNHKTHNALTLITPELVIPSARAVDLFASDGSPEFEFNDTTTEGSDSDNREWIVRGRDEDFMIIDDSNDFGCASDPTESNFTEVFKIEAPGYLHWSHQDRYSTH